MYVIIRRNLICQKSRYRVCAIRARTMSGPPVILSSRRNVFRRREASRVATCTLLPTCKNKRSQKAKVSIPKSTQALKSKIPI